MATRGKKAKELAPAEPMQPHRPTPHEKRPKEGYTLCLNCNLVYFDKGWSRLSNKDLVWIKRSGRINKHTICPTCIDLSRKSPEGLAPKGILKVFGLSFNSDFWGLVKNIVSKENGRDPLKRILRYEAKKDGIDFFLSKKELATTLGKKIYQVYKKEADLKIDWLEKNELVRVYITKKEV